MARPTRLVTGTFFTYAPDGADSLGDPDEVPLSGLVVQFTPRIPLVVETGPDRVAFMQPIFGVTDAAGVLRTPDGTLGLRVPVSPPENFDYSVRIIPPDGSKVAPYTFFTLVTPGSGPWDISSAPMIPTPVSNPGVVIVQLENPQIANPGFVGWWLESTVALPGSPATGSGVLYYVY